MRNIRMLSKMWDADEKFAKGVSLNPRKGKMQMQLYMTGRLKSICKFEEKQVADYLGLKNSICNNEYQGSADTSVVKKASATANKPRMQIHQIPEK